MSTARQAVLDVLQPLGYPVTVSRLPDQIGKPTLAVFTNDVAPEGTGRMRRWTMSVHVLTPITDPVDADDDLETVLAKVLDAIDTNTGMHWSEAKRGTTNEAYQAFEISLWLLMREV